MYSSPIVEDAVTEYGSGSLSIDTARYQLSGGVRAFGVRFNSTGGVPSCADAAGRDELTLFVPAGKNLIPVLTLDMTVVQALKGCLGAATGEDIWEMARLTINVENSSSHGLANLKLIAKIEPDTNMDKPPRDIKMKKRVESYVLHYDGKAYSFPDGAHWWLMK